MRARRVGAARALDELEKMQQPQWASTLLTQAGVLQDPTDTVGVAGGRLLRVLRLMADLGRCSLADLREFAADEALDESSITLATWFGLLAVADDGNATIAPLIAAAWVSWTEGLSTGAQLVM